MQITLGPKEAQKLLAELQDNPGLKTVRDRIQQALNEQGPLTVDEITVAQIILSRWLENKPAFVLEGGRREASERLVVSLLEKLAFLRDRKMGILR